MIGRLMRRALVVRSVALLLLAACVETASAQLPARVATPYTLMDDEPRLQLQGGVETPVRGNGPWTGYGYLFYTRPHFLAEDLYLRLVIPPGYLISELIYDKWPSQHSAFGVGVSGGLWAESQAEWRDGRFEKGDEVELPERRRMTAKPTEYLKRLYYDCLTYDLGALRYLISVVGADRVLFGTDWPHQVHDVAGSLANTAALPPDQRDAIRGTTALGLFGI